jgi:hypothetical protein
VLREVQIDRDSPHFFALPFLSSYPTNYRSSTKHITFHPNVHQTLSTINQIQFSSLFKMPPKDAAEKKPASKAPASKAPAEKKEAGKKTAATGEKKKRTKTRKETYSSYIYKGMLPSYILLSRAIFLLRGLSRVSSFGPSKLNRLQLSPPTSSRVFSPLCFSLFLICTNIFPI